MHGTRLPLSSQERGKGSRAVHWNCMRAPTFTHERKLVAAGYLPIGVDEAGCGCLAGPVVAAACHLPLDSRMGEIRDSKLLSASQRERLLAELRDRGAVWATGSASVEEIDRVNIRQATYLAMRRAIKQLLDYRSPKFKVQNSKQYQNSNFKNLDLGFVLDLELRTSEIPARWYALVDAWHIPELPIPQRGIIHGDRLVKSIAAASIIAKVTRDQMMDELDAQFPQYGLSAHRGYATVAHREAIRKYGHSVIHRLTFRT